MANKEGATEQDHADYEEWKDSFDGDYIGRGKKDEWWYNRLQPRRNNEMMSSYVNTPGSQISLGGTLEQQQDIITNLSQVGAMTGQNVFQTGQQQQDYYNSLQNRRNGMDAVAQNMMNGRNRNTANVARQFAGRGVSGGVAAAGMNTAVNTADSEINSQMQKNARQNDQDLWNYVKRNQKVTGEAIAGGSDSGLASSMDTSQAEGMFGTVICTELHRQGLLDSETYIADCEVGAEIERELPVVMAGYRFLAAPIVAGMKKSKIFTKMVAFWAIPWAKGMNGEPSLRGDLVTLGMIPCFFVGLCLPKKKVAHV